jgi:hypothetical protein
LAFKETVEAHLENQIGISDERIAKIIHESIANGQGSVVAIWEDGDSEIKLTYNVDVDEDEDE